LSPEIIILVVAVLIIFTISYKIIPYRLAGNKKPMVAFLPKYRKEIQTNKTDDEIKIQIEGFGFNKVSGQNGVSSFTRGNVFGDFSIKLVKVNIKIERASQTNVTIFIDAGWFVTFDTGDFWQFLHELTERLKNA
jgi:hypothetical protein